MQRDCSPARLVADVRCLSAPVAPVCWIAHVTIHDFLTQRACGHNVSQQDRHGAVGTVSFDGLGTGQSLYLPALCLTWDNSTEHTEAELGTCCEAVLELG